jgi:ATP-binding cassette subfamily B protein
MKQRKKIDYSYFDKQAANQSQLIQLVSAMQDDKLHGCERKKRWEWERLQAAIFHLKTKALALRQYQDSGAVLINQSKNALITAMAAGYVLKGEMTLGMMLSVQYIIGQLNAPIDQLIQFMRSWQDARLSLNRLAEIHVQPEEEDHTDNYACLNLYTLDKDIQVNQLDFTYDGLHPVLHQINLTIPRGKQTAIVGMSGSGKTTLIKLLLGYYPPTGGDILINNTSLSNFSMADWRSHCGVVMQDGYLFSDSIAGNLAPGEEEIDLERLQYASRLTNMDEYIRSLPLGYNTLIGPDGMNLSQGQKQRLLIGRAIYKNPALLFLDEATNALDANNEREIMERLQLFFAGRTVITVAHRLSTVRRADQIVVIHQGGIAESGTHEELIDKHGYYYQLVKNQLEL